VSPSPRSVLLTVRSRASTAVLALVVLSLAACSSGGASSSPSASLAAAATATAAPTATPSAAPTPTPAPTYPLTVTDDQKTAVTIKTKPLKIASLTPAATEILFKIGVGSAVVAKAEDIDPFPPEAASLPVVSTFKGIDTEKIVSLGADLIVADTLNPADAVTQLRGLGLPVIVLSATSIDGALHDIELVGDAVGAGGAARDLTASMRARFDQLTAAAAGASTKPRVFYEIGAGDTIYTVPAESIYAEMLTKAGSTPITTDSSYVISLEKVVAADPEVILLGDGTAAADVAKRAGWSGMTAVKKNAIVVVNDTIVTRPGPRLVDGLAALIAAIHPEIAVPSPVPASLAP
jgi:iron complex transport system substrate-binding protein